MREFWFGRSAVYAGLVASGVFLTCGSFSGTSRAATPEQVDAAIKKGVTFLYGAQKQGNWEDSPVRDPKLGVFDVKGGQWGGMTAIATYALLAAGESPQEPHIVQAVDFLEKADIQGIYALGMRAQVWGFLPHTPVTQANANKDAKLLVNAMSLRGATKGFYSYTLHDPNFHNSPSQYGVLGVWACAREGVTVPPDYWEITEEGWLKNQQDDGGWAYNFKPTTDHPVNAAFTAAGVATLFITQDYVHGNAGLTCKGNIKNADIDRGLRWIDAHFATVNDLYSWYGIERIGVASGYKYFGKQDWYKEGSEKVVRSQGPDGHWDFWGHQPAGTAFAMLFLARGRAPVVVNKLQYELAGKPGNWNQRPRDAANATRWAAEQLESDLNWQVVSLNLPVEELHDAPIVYIAGNQPLKFTEQEIVKLRTFAEQGGIILGNADCGKADFSASFIELGEKMFPHYKFRELPATHLIYNGEEFTRAKWKIKPVVQGLSNGVREMMLLAPMEDLGRSWQSQSQQAALKPEAFQLFSDIMLYAVDKKGLRDKGVTYLVSIDPAVKPARQTKVARLQLGENWDPEPAGWQRLAAILNNQFKVGITTEPIVPGEGKLDPIAADTKPTTQPSVTEVRAIAFKRLPPDQIVATGGDPAKLEALLKPKLDEVNGELKAAEAKRLGALAAYRVAHLTGTGAFQLTAPQKAEILKFIAGGGTLVIDAAGGSDAFAGSAEKTMADLFGADGEKALEAPLPPDSIVYNLPNATIESVVYRPYAKRIVGKLKGPRVFGVEQGGRIVAFYSREDLSAGLVGQPVDGVIGYTPESATAIMRNIVLYAVNGPPPATRPSTRPVTGPTTAPATP